MPLFATGSFEVQLQPLDTPDPSSGEVPNRLSLDKQLHGDLEAVGKGQMLSAMGSVKGSAGYVAIERITGALHGRTGSFVLQHSGLMDRGAPSLTITIVPDTGTGELTGIAGTLNIRIEDKKHFYDLTYTLPELA